MTRIWPAYCVSMFAVLAGVAFPRAGLARHRRHVCDHGPHRHAPGIRVYGGAYLNGGAYIVIEPPPPAVLEAPPAPEPSAPAAPTVEVARPVPPPRLERQFGIGVRSSAMRLGEDEAGEAEGVGAFVRFRRGATELELELGQDKFVYQERVDTRLGGAVYVYLSQSGILRPYILAGLGINGVSLGSDIAENKPTLNQAYLEGGGGLAVRLGERFVISGDGRWSSRRERRSDEVEVLETCHVEEWQCVPTQESGFEMRLSGIIYF